MPEFEKNECPLCTNPSNIFLPKNKKDLNEELYKKIMVRIEKVAGLDILNMEGKEATFLNFLKSFN